MDCIKPRYFFDSLPYRRVGRHKKGHILIPVDVYRRRRNNSYKLDLRRRKSCLITNMKFSSVISYYRLIRDVSPQCGGIFAFRVAIHDHEHLEWNGTRCVSGGYSERRRSSTLYCPTTICSPRPAFVCK